MKKTLLTLALAASVLALPLAAQDKPQKFEFATIKWDGPDRIQYFLPNGYENVNLRKNGVTIPKGAQEEEFCLNYAANELAKKGWEVVAFDSRRVMLRRSVAP